MLTPRPVTSLRDQELGCRAALVEAQSLVDMALARLNEAQGAAPPPIQGVMADVVTRLQRDSLLLKAATDSMAGEA